MGSGTRRIQFLTRRAPDTLEHDVRRTYFTGVVFRVLRRLATVVTASTPMMTASENTVDTSGTATCSRR